MANLKVKKGDTTYTIKLYDTEAAAGQPRETTGTLKIHMGNTDYFARITQHLGSDAAGGATPLRYKKADGTIYQVTQKGEFPIIVPASSGQTVCVSANGQTYKGANTLWFAEGTEWTAYVEVADSSHIAGSLNLTGGTLNSTVTLSVTPAAAIPSGAQPYEYDSTTTNVWQFTVPEHITVLHIAGTTENGKNATYNIKVTPGKTYSITGQYDRWKVGGRYSHSRKLLFNELQISYLRAGQGVTMTISWSPTINTYGTDHDFS